MKTVMCVKGKTNLPWARSPGSGWDISGIMPVAPGSCGTSSLLIACILHLNGLVLADAAMDAHSLPKAQMPNRDNFVLDDRQDTVRYMRDCK